MAIRKIKIRRGLEAQLPTLDIGEPGFTTDTKRFFIGSATGNIEYPNLTAVQALIDNIDVEGLATEEYVDNAISEIDIEGSGPVQPYLELTNDPIIKLDWVAGTPVSFTKSEETPTDEIEENLILARGNQGAIYNEALEQEYDRDTYLSPLGTLWNSDGWGDLNSLNTREYTTFRSALNGRVGNNILDAELVMWDTQNNKYYKFEFSQWGEGSGSSAFAYTRTLINNPNLFVKTDYGSEVDEISEGLHITRGNNQSLFNPLVDEGWDSDVTPTNSLWNFDGWDDLSNTTSREYLSLDDAFDNGYANIPGSKAIMKDTTTNKYWAIQFLTWTQNNNGGGFSYLRYELDITKLNEGIKFADGSVLKSAQGLGRVKSTASGERRIEEVAGSKTVSVTEVVTDDYELTSNRTTSTNFEIFITRTIGSEVDLLISEDWNGEGNFTYYVSFDNITFREVWLSSIRNENDSNGPEYWFYYREDGDNQSVQVQGNPVYLRITSGGNSVIWWRSSELPGGSSNFRGAVIDYHAYVVNEGTIIGTIHIADDDGDENITHTETSSGSSDLIYSDLWHVTDEGRIRFRQLNGEAKTLKVHWIAKVFYGEEYYD
jgi:hypothetical protein